MTEVARGLEGIVVAQTRLSRVDGQAGELVIGGYPVGELAPRASYEEVLHLLWHGRLPTVPECEQLRRRLAEERFLPAVTLLTLRAAAEQGVSAMEALRMGVATLSLEDSGAVGREQRLSQAIGLVARFPTIVAAYGRLRGGGEPIAPDPELGHAANYLYMLAGERPDEEKARALETYLNTVVDHGMNASTFTARVIASTRSDMVSALVGAIGALKGPLHGGAPGPALEMLLDLRARAQRSGHGIAEEVEAWTRETLAARGRIMGFGHRVYKVRDPRAAVLAGPAARLFERRGQSDLYRDALQAEEVILRLFGELKPGRSLQTNVELYTALILHAIGLDAALFSPTFAVGRAGGWTAHVLEQFAEDHLIRPSSTYVGACDQKWVPAEAR